MIKWLNADRPAWASMVETTLLNDGSLLTYEVSSDSTSVGPSVTCITRNVNAPITAESRFVNSRAVTAWRAQGSLNATVVQDQAVCVPDVDIGPVTEGTTLISLERWDGAAWQTLDTYTPTLPSTDPEVPLDAYNNTVAFDTGTRSVSTTTCRLRVVVAYSFIWTGSNNTFSITNTLKEWTLTQSDTGVVCSDNDVDEEGGGGGEDCECEWTAGAECSATWAAGTECDTTWTDGTDPEASTWTRTGCA